MADFFYGDDSLADKPFDNKLLSGITAMDVAVHPTIVANDLVSPDQQVAVLALIDATGSASLGDCMAAIQPHDRPVAALIALAERGLLVFDQTAAFDEHVTLRR